LISTVNRLLTYFDRCRTASGSATNLAGSPKMLFARLHSINGDRRIKPSAKIGFDDSHIAELTGNEGPKSWLENVRFARQEGSFRMFGLLGLSLINGDIARGVVSLSIK
jgi:hypothetical protein